MNEEALLKLIRQALPVDDASVIIGSGDDCAIVQPPSKKDGLVLKTDATVEEIHFSKNENLSDVGWKALCRALSDFAAMGAIPQHALITVAAPTSFLQKNWMELCRGIAKAAHQFHIIIVGGEITRSPGPLFLSVTLTGRGGPSYKLRSHAHLGDLICVTGKLGGSLKSRRHLTFTPRLLEGQWLASQKDVHAMMDLSDGLGSDLPRLARASNCSFQLNLEQLPCHFGCSIEEALRDGEDYELLLTIAPEAWRNFHLRWKKKQFNLTLTPIGVITPPDQPPTLLPSGFDHLGV